MNDVAGPDTTTGRDTSPGSPPRDGAVSGAPGCLRTIGTLGLIFGVVAVLGFVCLLISLQRAFPPMQAVPAPVAWTSREVVLSADRSVVHGRLTLTASAAPKGDLRVGLNAGVPSTEVAAPPSGPGATSPSVDPAELLSGPPVRLTAATASGSPQSCFAPCELQLPSALQCDSGTCRIDFDVIVELVPGSARRGAVTVGVAGGATAPLDKHLPDGIVVDLALEGEIAPTGS
jgi:hypothetical protein